VSKITANPLQPRREFDPEAIEELAESLRKDGILQPLLVRPVTDQPGFYELIAGERRLRAARFAGLETVPVLVKEKVSPLEALQWALVENIQRRDLNPIEEARGYQRLVEEFEMTQAAVAEQVSKNRVSITHSMRLLKLPDIVQNWIADGSLSVGHAKAILGLSEPEAQKDLAAAAIGQGWNVRQTEDAVRKILNKHQQQDEQSSTAGEENERGRENWVVEKLQRQFGARVRLRGKGDKGKIEVYYGSPEELERLLNLWGIQEEL
jgi:ParB family chromosome partitioning protein